MPTHRPVDWITRLEAAGARALLIGPGALPRYHQPDAPLDDDSVVALISRTPLPEDAANLPGVLCLDVWHRRHDAWLASLLGPLDAGPGQLRLPDAMDHAVLTLLPGPLRDDSLTLALLAVAQGDLASFPARADALLGTLAGELAANLMLEVEWQTMLERYRDGGDAH